MKIEKVTLTNFRNYQKQTLNLGSGIHFIIGANGEGKTNFLEAIYVLALAKSYKVEDSELIKYGEDFARIQATIVASERKSELTMIVTEIGKKAMSNENEIKRLSDYIGNLNIVSFLPEDTTLIKGSPRDRRYYIDVFLGQIDKNYLNDLSKYKHILKQRNELLKKMSDANDKEYTLLDVITEQLAEQADKIIHRRRVFQKEINVLMQKMYQKLSNKKEVFVIEYMPSILAEDTSAFLKTKYRQDLMQKATGFGPHRDDYDFMIDQYFAKNHASQGEQRMMVLALNMGLAEMVYLIKGERPVFLLDDVFSELDTMRQNKLLEYLASSQMQAIITSTNLNEIKESIKKQAKIFRVSNGYIKEEL